MKVSVRVRGEWFQVPCKDGIDPISWLGEESLKRYSRSSPEFSASNGTSSEESQPPMLKPEHIASIRKTKGGALLDNTDRIRDVLDDNDFITVVLDSDRPHPLLERAEIKYTVEQISGKYTPPDEYLTLDGESLSPSDLVNLGKGLYKIRLSKDAEDKVIRSRELVEEIVKEKKVVYGVTTGFGKFAKVVVSPEQLDELQVNLIRSHAAGVGNPLTPDKTRMLMTLRINVLAKGYSGISLGILNIYIAAFNASCLPWVPEKGTVGASGDLAPLAHLAIGLMGEGKMWSPKTGWGDAKYVLESHNLTPMVLKAKEGIALINGTQLITSFGAEALERAETIALQADVVAALTLEVLKGTSRAFDNDVSRLRNHKGQGEVARRVRGLLHSETYPSEIAESHRFCDRVQDAYTMRCCPQVHGIVHDTLHFVRGIISEEMNSATDNPLVLPERGELISAGNFHGEYPAKACDYLAIAIHEIASMSERRTERLVNPALSELPAFLTKEGGLNSGFMMAHCTAAALVSENKVLCHPASVDSLTTSAGQEDHVSMGGFSARKALTVVENVERVIAIELLAACQAIEFLRPLKTTPPLEEVIKTVRAKVAPWLKDRFMSPDIDAVTELLKDNKIWNAVRHHIDHYHAQQDVETRVFSPTASWTGTGRYEKPRNKRPFNGPSYGTSKSRKSSTVSTPGLT